MFAVIQFYLKWKLITYNCNTLKIRFFLNREINFSFLIWTNYCLNIKDWNCEKIEISEIRSDFLTQSSLWGAFFLLLHAWQCSAITSFFSLFVVSFLLFIFYVPFLSFCSSIISLCLTKNISSSQTKKGKIVACPKCDPSKRCLKCLDIFFTKCHASRLRWFCIFFLNYFWDLKKLKQ